MGKITHMDELEVQIVPSVETGRCSHTHRLSSTPTPYTIHVGVFLIASF
jgi:hypothetical protein